MCLPQSHNELRLTLPTFSATPSRVRSQLQAPTPPLPSTRYLSARNIPYLNLMSLDNLNCRDILRAKKVFVSTSAMEELKTRYGA